MNATAEKLFDQIYKLETKSERLPFGEEKDNLRLEIRELQDEYTALNRIDCVADGIHMKQRTSQGGYDVCFNCGAKS